MGFPGGTSGKEPACQCKRTLEWVHFLCSLKEFLSFLLFLGGYYFTSTWTKLIFHEKSLPFQGHTTGSLPNFFFGHRTTSWPMK